jgi:pimeloyl-ACP methyl ester carboxylesterase
MRPLRLALCVGVGAITAAGIAGAVYERVGMRRDREMLPQTGRSVDIGGRSLNIYCSGSGAPTVIFDPGNGDPGFAWAPIQSEVSRITRACWYDRAGYGWSDPGAFPRTSAAMAHDLHELLHRAAVPGPYVLVGHSLGGLNARVYTGRYPDEVAGAVLVDAAHEDEPRRAPRFMLAPYAPPRWSWRAIWIAGQTARVLGLIRLVTPRAALPADPAMRPRAEILEALRRQPKTQAELWDATLPESYLQAEHTPGFGCRPLVVLTRGNARLPERPTTEDREWIAYEQVWMHDIQPKLARLSTRGRQIIVAESGHRIHEEAPQAIVQAVAEVVEALRTEQAHDDHAPAGRLTNRCS